MHVKAFRFVDRLCIERCAENLVIKDLSKKILVLGSTVLLNVQRKTTLFYTH
jgi:hypothetical protein